MDSADLVFAGITEQAAMLRRKEVTARELAAATLERIAALEPRVNAFRTLQPERVLAAADAAQERLDAGDDAPLLGVPIAVKDDLPVAGEVTGKGSLATGDRPEAVDAALIASLREAGAVLCGRTNVPELMTSPWTETLAAGATRNPWDLERSPGGSSGGSAAAVAAGMVGAAIASDGAGSIRIPAAACGLVGLKPSAGRISTAPAVDPWNGLSTWGCVTRTVRDTALFLDAVATPSASGPLVDAAASGPAGPLRIAVSTRMPTGAFARVSDEALQALRETADRLRALGHHVADADPGYTMGATNAVLVRYLNGIKADADALPFPHRLEPHTRTFARMGSAFPASVVAAARARQARDVVDLNAVFDTHDVVLTPMLAHRPFKVGTFVGRGGIVRTLRSLSYTPWTATWNHTGQPAAAIPAGFAADGFPRSVQLVGRPDDEWTLVALAAQLEREVGWPERRPELAA